MSFIQRLATVLTASALFSLAGCTTNQAATPNEDAGTADTGTGATDLGTTDDASVSCEVPSEGYGASVGTKLLPFTLDRCFVNDDGVSDSEPFAFYENGYCEARFTVLSIAAGWCGPCNVESDEFKEQISEMYGPLGVRLIQVIIQDNDGFAPSLDFCNAWVAQHDLINPELIDPAGVTQIYFPGNSLPSTIIIDNTGTIVYREYGASESLIGLRNKLDQLLAE